MITISQQRTDVTKETFKNVPWDIPDEEIINLCEVYGIPINNRVQHEPMPRPYHGIRGPNRSVEMQMKPGKQFENFDWMEGPLEEDRGCRITVLHQGQEQQCSHCLRRSNSPAGGNGKACQLLNTPRGKIGEYMKYLKTSHDYLSLKMKYKQKKDQDVPALGQRKIEDDGFGHMVAEDIEDPDGENKNKDGTKEDLPEDVLNVDPANFTYDENTDTVKPVDEKAFEELVEQHPSVHKLKRDDKREEKIAGLKTKVLQTLKVKERKHTDLSCDSIKIDCSGWGGNEHSDSRGEVRPRPPSGDEENLESAKKSHRQTRPLLRPPKILISKK